MLSSSEIDRRKLVDPDIVIAKYLHYHKKDKVTTLAQKLAEQFYFGDEFLSQVYGIGDQSLSCTANFSLD